MKLTPLVRHSNRPEAMFTRGGNGMLVLSKELVPVRTDDCIVKVATGKARCALCNRTFANDAKGRMTHTKSGLHQRRLREAGGRA